MNTITIIGRANVGKSTLFNRLSEKRSAMVSNTPGTTRDLKYNKISWTNHVFELIDTGGFLANQKTPLKDLTRKEEKQNKKESSGDINKQVETHAREALIKSNIIVFVVDAQEGLNPQDKQIAEYLRKIKDKKIILTVNKCDNPKLREQTAEFYKLGLGEPILISGLNGSGTGDLLDQIVKLLDKEKNISDNQLLTAEISVSILGKPNVGKSSLLNTLIGYDKAIVSATAHTTREPNDEIITFEKHKIKLIDTAGIRRKAKVDQSSLEKLGIKMSISSLKKSDIALLILDLNEPISHQDLQLGKLIIESHTGVIIVANKYDLVIQNLQKNKIDETKSDLIKEFKQNIYSSFPHLKFAPIIFISAKTGLNTKKILKLILDTNKENQIRISDNALSKFLKTLIKKQPPPRKKIGFGSKTKIKRSYITNFKQIDINPPLFECTIGSKEKLPEEYRRYLINNLRDKFGFKGVPINLKVKYQRDTEK